MATGLPGLIQRGVCWLTGKSFPAAGMATGGYGDYDATMEDILSSRPHKRALINAYTGVVYTCSTINAEAVASVPLRLYVTTSRGQRAARVPTKAVSGKQMAWLRSHKATASRVDSAEKVEEVTAHPLLDLLNEVNTRLNRFDLFELTDLAQELCGNAYWYVPADSSLGIPGAIWFLPPHLVEPKRDKEKIISHYEFGRGPNREKFSTDEIIHFRFPNPKDPYCDGWSPARACWESIQMIGLDQQYAEQMYSNHGLPRALLSPKEGGLGEPESKRLEKRLRKKFKQGKGGIAIASESYDVKTLQLSSHEMEALARFNVSERQLYNAYRVPMSFSDKDSNRASAEAGHYQHAKLAVLPRVLRLGEELSQSLCPKYDERLFIAPDNPVPEDVKLQVHQQRADSKTGDTLVNERRASRGLEPVEWGDYPSFDAYIQATTPQQPEEPPAPPPEEPAEEEPPEKAIDLLISHACGRIGRDMAVSGLERLGKTHSEAIVMTKLPQLPAPQTCHHRETPAKGRQLPKGTTLRNKLKATFRSQKAAVLEDLKKHMPEKSVKDWSPPPEWREAIDLGDWSEVMATDYRPTVEITYQQGIDEAVQRLSMEGAFDVQVPEVREAISRHTFMFCETTNATTTSTLEVALDKLAEELSEGLFSPDNLATEMVKRVNAVFDQAERHRAERIALTESSRAVHNGEILAGQRSGVVQGYEYLLSANACEICHDMKRTNPYTPIGDALRQMESYKRTIPPIHPYCVVGDTPVMASDCIAGMRALYSGPVVEICLADGRRLTVTPNHMFMVPDGFASAASLRPGDNVFDCSAFERALAGDPNDYRKPATIKEIVATLSESRGVSACRVPVSPEYLHGDAVFCEGNVDVVATDGFLGHDTKASATELVRKRSLGRTDVGLVSFDGGSNLTPMLLAMLSAANGSVGEFRVPTVLLGRHPGRSNLIRLAHGSLGNTPLDEVPADGGSGYSEILREISLEFPGEVALTNIVDVRISELTNAHVYDLHTTSTLYLANGIVSSNCMCTTTERLKEIQE